MDRSLKIQMNLMKMDRTDSMMKRLGDELNEAHFKVDVAA